MNHSTPPLLLLLPCLLFFGACSTTQSWVGGGGDAQVTDQSCPSASETRDCPSTDGAVARGITAHTLDRARHQAVATVEAAQTSDDRDASPRRPHELTENIAHEPIDPSAGRQLTTDAPQIEDLLDDEDRQANDIDRFFEGHFDDDASSTIAHYRPGEYLRFHHGDQLLTTLALDTFDPHLPTGDILQTSTGPVDLVAGDTHQLMLIQRQTDDGLQTYYLTIYKLIAQRVGTIFSEPIAYRDADDSLVRTLDIRFLHGTDHRVIEAIPLDEAGQPEGEPRRYEWNAWEGVYRLPQTPPTAPDDPVASCFPQFPSVAFSTFR